ncbi:MAG TPA: ribosomal protein S18-alanine N-acetyltransferase [Kineosporiaceae bacterium]|nr:ribosomal protein S18-alanine N-acetyltransferase [Kineosporiaceae bacterium]
MTADVAGPVGVRLRPMRWWDVDAVHGLDAELFGPTAWTAAMFWSELAGPNRWYVVAEREDGALAGYAGLMVGGSEADVQTIGVAPAAQGRGVGTLLLRALVGEAARRGAASLLLEVRADNVPAIALYGREGFARIAVRRRYYQPGGVDAWVMRRRPLRAPAGTGARGDGDG